jgi:iron complex outermembrane recepter protein
MLSSPRGVALTVALLSPFPEWALAQGGASAGETNPPQQGTAAPGAAPAEPAQPAAPSDQGTETVTAPAGGEQKFGEEIVVTGSRIRRKDLTTPAPVTVLSREQVQASGKLSIGDFLQSLPEQGNANGTQVNNGGNGETRVNLRGLGDNRTLVLLNGRRIVPVGNQVFSETTVDLNTIPSSAIERIEVLKDGASAVYGSDAIGGVVNIITRKNFNGTEVSAYGGQTTHGDGRTYDTNLTLGTASDRGHILFNAEYYKQEPIFAGDRAFSSHQIAYDFSAGKGVNSGSSNIPAGQFTIPVTRDADGKVIGCKGSGTPLFQELCDATVKSGNTKWLFDPTSATVGGLYRQYRGAADAFNFQPFNYNLIPSQRVSLFSTGETGLASNARAYYEASYVNRQSNQQLAPVPLPTEAVGSNGVFLSKDSIYNPFGVDIFSIHRRLAGNAAPEFPPRQSIQDYDTFRVVAGLNGSLPTEAGPLSGWFWDTSVNYGRTQGTQQFVGSLQVSHLQNALGPSGRLAGSRTPVCLSVPAPDPNNVDPNSSSIIANCVPLNLLHVDNGLVTPDQAAGIGYTGVSRNSLQMVSIQANTSGELFTLMADRPVGLALGYEYRHELGANIPDPIGAAGDSTDFSFKATQGGFHVNEGYAELSIPIINKQPYIWNLEATAAGRVSDYSNFGTQGTYKLGARYSAIPDFTLRGTFSTAFRAPSIAELFLGQSDNFPNAIDPCSGFDPIGNKPKPIPPDVAARCAAAANNGDTSTQIKTHNGGFAGLKPETANIFTAGIVLEPRWVKNLSVTVDYWNFRIFNSILNSGGQVILNGCYARGIQSYCNQIHRDPRTQSVILIDDLNTNVGNDKVDGIDVALRYGLPTQVGRFGFLFDGTWLHKYDRILGDGSTITGKGTFDLAGNSGFIGGVYPDFKFNTGVNWNLGGFGAGVTMRYIGGYKECAAIDGSNTGGLCYLTNNPASGFTQFPTHHVSAYSTFDLSLGYRLNTAFGRTTLGLGVNNVFDKTPPIVFDSFTPQSDPTAYDFLGRFVYLRLTQNI